MGPLTLLALFGLAFGIGRVARLPISQAFFVTAACVILVLYAGALAGVLWWTALAVHAAGVALLGVAALSHARGRTAVTVSVPVPVAVLALLCAWFWIVHGEDQYFLHDEYSHWGVFIKEMLALDGFWTADTNALHPRYPPAAPLWQYLFNAFLPPSEARTYFAHFVLLLAPLLALWNSVRWSQPFWIVAILALVVVAVANFGLGVSTLYVDPMVGAWYLGTLLAALADREPALRRVVVYAAPLAVIALLKDVGLCFALSGAVIVCTLFRHGLGRSSSAWLRTGIALLLLAAPALLAVQAWSWNRDAVGATSGIHSLGGVLDGIRLQLTGAALEHEAEIARRFWEVFFGQQISNSPISWEYAEFSYGIRDLYTDRFPLTTFGLLAAFVVWWAFVCYAWLPRESRGRWLLVAGGVLITSLAYIAALHSSYQFSFGERGLELPSYVRYIQVVALPMLLVSFLPLLPAFAETSRDATARVRTRYRAGILTAAVIALCAFETPYLRPILEPNPPVERRAAVEPHLAAIGAAVGRSRLWVYFPGDTDSTFFGHMVQYLLAPTPVAVEDSPGFFENADADTIASTWREIDYVWVAEIPTVEAGIGLARFTAGPARPGLYRPEWSDDRCSLIPLVDATAAQTEP